MGTSARTYEVTWWTDDRAPFAGRLEIAGTHADLSGEESCTFELDDVRAVVVTPEPAVHVRVRRRGWLTMSVVGTSVAAEVARQLAGTAVA